MSKLKRKISFRVGRVCHNGTADSIPLGLTMMSKLLTQASGKDNRTLRVQHAAKKQSERLASRASDHSYVV